MKKRYKQIDDFAEQVCEFKRVLDNERGERGDQRYKKVVAQGLLLLLFVLERICTGLFILLGILFALVISS